MVLDKGIEMPSEQTREAEIDLIAQRLARHTGRETNEKEKLQLTALAAIYHEINGMFSNGPDTVKDPHRVFHLLGLLRNESIPTSLQELTRLNAPHIDEAE